jgi:hypothetical protein
MTMPTTTIFCPACNNKLRVPDELMAQPVECPKCGASFTAPPPMSGPLHGERERPNEGQPVPVEPVRPEQDEDFGRRSYDWDSDEPQATGGAKLTIPAVLLMILAGVAMLDSLARIVIGLFLPKVIQQLEASQAQMFGQPPPNLNMRAMQVVAGVIFALLSTVTFLGGIAMLRRQLYGLAIAGSIAAMLNLIDCCCVFGLPVGIWALIVLLRPEVKASFS